MNDVTCIKYRLTYKQSNNRMLYEFEMNIMINTKQKHLKDKHNRVKVN